MFKKVYDVYVHRFENINGVYVAEDPVRATIPTTTDPTEFAEQARKYGVWANRNWIEFDEGKVIVEGHSDDKHVYFDKFDDAIAYTKAVWRREAV